MADPLSPATAPLASLLNDISAVVTRVPSAQLALAPRPNLQVASPDPVIQSPAIAETCPTPAVSSHKARRRGRVARLPQHARDLVNRMLRNDVPYKNIVGALDELGFTVLERNISSWATSGHKDWCLKHDLVLQNRLDQDHLVDHLRRDNAAELPEVGLQAAATRLLKFFFKKPLPLPTWKPIWSPYERMVGLLCRLNRELGSLQQERDNSRRSLGREHDPVRIKDCDEFSAHQLERSYSNPGKDSELAKPAQPPELSPPPTSSFLAQCDRENEELRREIREARFKATLQAFNPLNKK